MSLGEHIQKVDGLIIRWITSVPWHTSTSCQYCSNPNPRWTRNHNGFVVCLCTSCAHLHAGTVPDQDI